MGVYVYGTRYDGGCKEKSNGLMERRVDKRGKRYLETATREVQHEPFTLFSVNDNYAIQDALPAPADYTAPTLTIRDR